MYSITIIQINKFKSLERRTFSGSTPEAPPLLLLPYNISVIQALLRLGLKGVIREIQLYRAFSTVLRASNRGQLQTEV